MTVVEPSIPLENASGRHFRHEVIVIGGGVSGSVAAIAAARAGAKVLLVEEHGFLGGSLPAMGVGPMMSFHNPAGELPRFTWPQLWRTRSLWGLLLSRFISDPVWYFCLFWLPGYLQENSGLTLAQIGMVGWIPFLAADLGGVGGFR